MAKPAFKISAEQSANKAVIRIDGYISGWSNFAAQFKQKLDELLAAGITDATVYINSGGGDCFQANEIANEISRFKGTITGHLGALCASAATYIACKCNTVMAAKNVQYMIHKPMAFFEGNTDEVKAMLKLLENLQDEYASTYADKTGIKKDRIEALWAHDYWMNADEAKKLGFIDDVEGETAITEEDVQAISAYASAPKISATTNNTNTIIMKIKDIWKSVIAFLGVKANDAITEDMLQKMDDGLATLATVKEELATATTAKKTAEDALTAAQTAKTAAEASAKEWKDKYEALAASDGAGVTNTNGQGSEGTRASDGKTERVRSQAEIDRDQMIADSSFDFKTPLPGAAAAK